MNEFSELVCGFFKGCMMICAAVFGGLSMFIKKWVLK